MSANADKASIGKMPISNFTFDKETREHLNFLAGKFRLSKSSVLRLLVAQAYERNKPEMQVKI